MDRVVRLRPRWRQAPWWLFWIPAGNLANVFLADRDVPPHPVFQVLAVVIAVAFVAAVWWGRTLGADLRPDALVVRGLRRHVIPWADVTWIGPAPRMGTQAIGVMARGHPLRRLRAPTHTPFLAPDPDFADKARTIHDYWVAHHSPQPVT